MTSACAELVCYFLHHYVFHKRDSCCVFVLPLPLVASESDDRFPCNLTWRTYLRTYFHKHEIIIGPKHHTDRCLGDLSWKLHAFLTLVLRGGDQSVIHTGRLNPGEKSLRDPLDRSLCGYYRQSGRTEENKITLLCRHSNPGCLARRQ